MASRNISSPPLWLLATGALACCIIVEELLGNDFLSPLLSPVEKRGEPSSSVSAFPLICFVQAVGTLGILACRGRIESVVRSGGWLLSASVVAVLGIIALTVVRSSSALLYYAGVGLVALGCLFVKVTALLILASLPLRNIKKAVLTAIPFQTAVIFVAMTANAHYQVICTLLFLFALAAALFAFYAERQLRRAEPPSRIPFKRPMVLVAPVIVGFVVLCATATFLSPLASTELIFHLRGTTGLSWTIEWIATKAIAIAVLVGTFLLIDDLCYHASARIITTMTLTALIGVLVMGDTWLSHGMSLIALSLLEFVPLVAVVDLASYTASSPLRITCGYLFVFRCAELAGSLLGILDNHLGAVSWNYSYLGFAVFVLAAFSSIWLLDERKLNLFFWGAAPTDHYSGEAPSVAQDMLSSCVNEVGAPREIESDIEHLARNAGTAHGLTPREIEVLVLLGKGRSATFIAEELFLSANTVRTHISRIYAKMDVHSKQELLTLVQNWAVSSANVVQNE